MTDRVIPIYQQKKRFANSGLKGPAVAPNTDDDKTLMQLITIGMLLMTNA